MPDNVSAAVISKCKPPLQRRSWFSMIFWALIFINGMFIALAIRIHLGLQEAEIIRTILQREGESYVTYNWEVKRQPFPGYEWLMAGMLGRSCANVKAMTLVNATDAELKMICTNFPNLESLFLPESTVLPETFALLPNLHKLTDVGLSDTNLDDGTVVHLASLHRLKYLLLRGTLITDKAITTLKKLPDLEIVNLDYTEVSLKAIEDWRKASNNLLPHITTEKEFAPNGIHASIRWSDGRRSGTFRPETGEIRMEGPLDSTDQPKPQQSFLELGRMNYWLKSLNLNELPNGDYWFSLFLDEHEVAPVIIQINHGKPSTHFVQFQMPCTKAEALRANR